MKTRAEIYGQEATELLRLVSMYPGILEVQLLRFFSGKESRTKNLLSHLKKQGRILKQENGGYIPSGHRASSQERDTVKAVWVLLDFIEKADFHSVSDFPVNLIFFAGGELYEIISVPAGLEMLITRALRNDEENTGRRIVVVDSPEQIPVLEFPNISGFCTVDGSGHVTYYQKATGGM